ncbi:uncharacterized protein LOC127350821 [Dicentrarchus labrax]|uniref:uncharacterized protein LOC127350821 n=1 Tax=Dicentrarchus labrax TaxID=13489 RepID=UPI0021F637B9|nr:uncharacterized protein LOC127350821 [Dicentrarchus labrax]
MDPKPKLNYNSFESLVLSLSHPNWKTLQPVLFVIVYRAPGPYSDFISEFSEFLSSLVLKSDKVIIVGDFNIHVDVDNDSLSNAFISLIDSIGFCQSVNKPTHCFNHTLDLDLFPHNPFLSDHYLLTFEFILLDYKPLGKTSYSRCLSDSAVAKFKEEIPSVFNSMPCLNLTESYNDFSPSEIDNLVDSAAGSLRSTLDSIAPIKRKLLKHRRLAPWYNHQTRQLKQIARKSERKWRSSKLLEYCSIWHDHFKIYRKALRNARGAYYSALKEENKNNPRFLFSTVARLTESHSSIEPHIPITLSTNDFMSFFYNKIITIREKINNQLPSTGISGSPSSGTLNIYLSLH